VSGGRRLSALTRHVEGESLERRHFFERLEAAGGAKMPRRHALDQSDREHVCNRAPSNYPLEGVPVEQNRTRNGLQARRRRAKKLAPSRRSQPVAKTDPGCEIYRRSRGHLAPNSSRRPTSSVTNFGDNSTASGLEYARRSSDINFCNRIRRFLFADVCGVEAVSLGGWEGATRADGYLPIQLDRRL
jgi:hypothetical protein